MEFIALCSAGVLIFLPQTNVDQTRSPTLYSPDVPTPKLTLSVQPDKTINYNSYAHSFPHK